MKWKVFPKQKEIPKVIMAGKALVGGASNITAKKKKQGKRRLLTKRPGHLWMRNKNIIILKFISTYYLKVKSSFPCLVDFKETLRLRSKFLFHCLS